MLRPRALLSFLFLIGLLASQCGGATYVDVVVELLKDPRIRSSLVTNAQQSASRVADLWSALFSTRPSPSEVNKVMTAAQISVPPVNEDLYDAVILAESLQSFGERGWQLVFGNPASRSTFEAFRGKLISFTGKFDVGKTYLMNQVLGGSFPSGVTSVTKGLSIAFRGARAYIDTAGSKRAISEGNVEDRLATDSFIHDITIMIADLLFYIVGPLEVGDYQAVEEVWRQLLLHSSQTVVKHLYVIHNFAHYTAVDQVEAHIKNDVVNAFGALEVVDDGCHRWEQQKGERSIVHLVLARDGSDAGTCYNKCAVKQMKTAVEAQVGGRGIKFPELVSTAVSQMLPEYFWGTDHNPISRRPPEPKSIFTMSYWQEQAVKAVDLIRARRENYAAVDVAWQVTHHKNDTFMLTQPRRFTYMPFDCDSRPCPFYEPPFDIVDTNEQWALLIDFPGFEASNVKHNIHAGNLRIKAKRPIPQKFQAAMSNLGVPGKGLKGSRRKYGEVSLSFNLPRTVDILSETHVFVDGVLVIEFKKQQEHKLEL